LGDVLELLALGLEAVEEFDDPAQRHYRGADEERDHHLALLATKSASHCWTGPGATAWPLEPERAARAARGGSTARLRQRMLEQGQASKSPDAIN